MASETLIAIIGVHWRGNGIGRMLNVFVALVRAWWLS